MALQYGHCNCGRGLAMVTYTMFGRESEYCQHCVDDYEREQLPQPGGREPLTAQRLAARGIFNAAPDPLPYSRQWHNKRIDTHLMELARSVKEWAERDREGTLFHYHLAARIRMCSNNLAADAAAIAALDHRDGAA